MVLGEHHCFWRDYLGLTRARIYAKMLTCLPAANVKLLPGQYCIRPYFSAMDTDDGLLLQHSTCYKKPKRLDV